MKSSPSIVFTGLSFTATLPLPPISNHRLIPINGRMVLAKTSRGYIKDVQKLRQGKPFESEVFLRIIFYRQKNQGDIDGRIKSLFDALTGVMFLDDSQIMTMEVHNSLDRLDPRVLVHCYPSLTRQTQI